MGITFDKNRLSAARSWCVPSGNIWRANYTTTIFSYLNAIRPRRFWSPTNATKKWKHTWRNWGTVEHAAIHATVERRKASPEERISPQELEKKHGLWFEVEAWGERGFWAFGKVRPETGGHAVSKIERFSRIRKPLGNKAGLDLTGYRKLYFFQKKYRIVYAFDEKTRSGYFCDWQTRRYESVPGPHRTVGANK